MDNNIDTPEKAERLVFALDIVNYFFTKLCPDMLHEICSLDEVMEIQRHRKAIRVRFNRSVSDALDVINETQSRQWRHEFHEILKKVEIDLDSWIYYCNDWVGFFLSDEIQPKQYLRFCARLASMACYFFAKGVPGAIVLTIHSIERILFEATMSRLESEISDEISGARYASYADDDYPIAKVPESQSTSAREVPSTSSAGVESVNAWMEALMVASACPDSGKSGSSEGDGENLSSTAESSKGAAAGQSDIDEDNAEKFPSRRTSESETPTPVVSPIELEENNTLDMEVMLALLQVEIAEQLSQFID